MTNLLTQLNRKAVLIYLATMVLALFFGCASHRAAEVEAGGAKMITDITTSEDATSTIVTVKGNRLLTYTAIKQDFPRGVLFHFPDTALDNIEKVYYPPANDAISSIKASQVAEAGRKTTARIFIALKRDVPYEITPEETGLRISFPKPAAQPSPTIVATEAKSEPQKPAPPPVPAATRVKSVKATGLAKYVIINVAADGTIKNYKSFTIGSGPARIVFDMFGLKSPYTSEKRIAVKSKFVSRVRYCGHPDKLRLVVDTHKAYLTKFSAVPTDSGLLIYVGQAPATPAPTPTVRRVKPPKMFPAATKSAGAQKAEKKAGKLKNVAGIPSGKPAWLNRLDFSGEKAGKSTIIIGTTHPVKYDLKKVADKRLQLTLFNTNLPDYRKRALITTRFESAVDRITPLQSPAPHKNTLISIELRQSVPYFVDHKDDTIRVHFAPSSIPPKPYETATMPAWKKALTQGEAQPAGAPSAKAPSAKAPPAKTAAPAKGAAQTAATQPPAVAQQAAEEKRLALGEAPKKYTGEKIALDFYDTDIKNVFRILREISGKNFAIDKNVTGKVTLTLAKPVPWDQVLDLVLKMNQLGMTMEGNIVRIATLATLAQEDKMRQAKIKAQQQLVKQKEALEPLNTVYIPINYANAQSEVLPHLQAILTQGRGKVSVDARNNQVILTDTAAKIAQAEQIVKKIDQVTPQVVIEARVVEANSNFSRDLGFDWGTVTLGTFKIGDFDIGPTTFMANNIDPNVVPNGQLGFNFTKLTGTPFSIINARLEAAEVEGNTNIVSAPKIVTIDNKKARIKQGFEVPYLERDSSGNATVRFKDVDLLLEVTPHVTPDNRISMSIFITKNDVVDPTAPEPALSTNEAETEILMDDGDTVVIGGILKSTINLGESGIPGLRKLPAMGWLFKSQSRENNKNELLIFLTPRIIRLVQKGM